MIDPRESLVSGIESLRHHALRSFLAMLGIIFGVGAVIAMLSIGAGAEAQALEIIDAMGLRNVVVKDKRFDRENELTEIRRKSAGLSSRDAKAISEAVPGVERVVAQALETRDERLAGIDHLPGPAVAAAPVSESERFSVGSRSAITSPAARPEASTRCEMLWRAVVTSTGANPEPLRR